MPVDRRHLLLQDPDMANAQLSTSRQQLNIYDDNEDISISEGKQEEEPAVKVICNSVLKISKYF